MPALSITEAAHRGWEVGPARSAAPSHQPPMRTSGSRPSTQVPPSRAGGGNSADTVSIKTTTTISSCTTLKLRPPPPPPPSRTFTVRTANFLYGAAHPGTARGSSEQRGGRDEDKLCHVEGCSEKHVRRTLSPGPGRAGGGAAAVGPRGWRGRYSARGIRVAEAGRAVTGGCASVPSFRARIGSAGAVLSGRREAEGQGVRCRMVENIQFLSMGSLGLQGQGAACTRNE